MPKLGVNIDHTATVREARKTYEPSPVIAAIVAERAGADSIVCHLREDRRHIKDEDLYELKKVIKTRLNLEMSIHPDIVRIAQDVKPHQATFVPERRQEITTEGGLDLTRNKTKLGKAINALQKKNIAVSLFIDPDYAQIRLAKKLGVKIIELHTGEYANAKTPASRSRELKRLRDAVDFARKKGLCVNAGHGLTYTNVEPVAGIKGIEELNIGHSIISRAVFVGLEQAAREMKTLVNPTLPCGEYIGYHTRKRVENP